MMIINPNVYDARDNLIIFKVHLFKYVWFNWDFVLSVFRMRKN